MLKWCALAATALVACTQPAQFSSTASAATSTDPTTSSGKSSSEETAASADAGATLPSGALNNGCAPAPGAGHQTITCADKTTFDIQVPDACAAGNCGIILDIHGYSMDGPQEDRTTQMTALAGPKGFITIQPTAPGTPPSWTNSEPTGRQFDYDDTVWGFFQAAMQRFGVDPKRVHMTGFSQGAMMTFRFLFAHGDTFASIAPIAGPDGFAFLTDAFIKFNPVDTPPPVKIPIMYTHGTNDRLLNFKLTAEPFRDQILKQYGLTTEDPFKTGNGFRASRWKDANGTIMFEFWNHDFEQGNIYIGGHCVAGPSKDGDGELLSSDTPFRCIPNSDFATIDLDVGTEILRFFTDHPKSN